MKKKYIKPETSVVKLSQHAALLSGSPYQLYDNPEDIIDNELGVI